MIKLFIFKLYYKFISKFCRRSRPRPCVEDWKPLTAKELAKTIEKQIDRVAWNGVKLIDELYELEKSKIDNKDFSVTTRRYERKENER